MIFTHRVVSCNSILPFSSVLYYYYFSFFSSFLVFICLTFTLSYSAIEIVFSFEQFATHCSGFRKVQVRTFFFPDIFVCFFVFFSFFSFQNNQYFTVKNLPTHKSFRRLQNKKYKIQNVHFKKERSPKKHFFLAHEKKIF